MIDHSFCAAMNLFLELYILNYEGRKLSNCFHDYFTHSKDSVSGLEVVSPGHTQYIGQVEAEVYDPPAGSS